MAQRQAPKSYSLEKHLSLETKKLTIKAIDGFYEVAITRGKYAVYVMGGNLGTHRIDCGYDKDLMKCIVGHREGKKLGPATGLYIEGYLNIMGKWYESWSTYDGEKTSPFEGDIVTFSLIEGKRHGEQLTVDIVEYKSTVEQLKADGYSKSAKPNGENEEKPEYWLLCDKMNIAR